MGHGDRHPVLKMDRDEGIHPLVFILGREGLDRDHLYHEGVANSKLKERVHHDPNNKNSKDSIHKLLIKNRFFVGSCPLAPNRVGQKLCL